MVGENDLGLGSFVPISRADLDEDQRAQVAKARLSEQRRDRIQAVVLANPDWHRLSVEDHAIRVLSALQSGPASGTAFSLTEVQSFLRRVRNRHQR